MFSSGSGPRVLAALGLLFVSAVGARAHHINGRVYCDTNFNGVLDSSDGRLAEVRVVATSQLIEPGATYAATSVASGFYSIGLPVHSDTYAVTLDPVTLPPTAVQLLPAGSHVIPIVSGSGATDHADDVHFLLQCEPTPPCLSNGECDDGNPCTDDRCDRANGCVHSNNAEPCDDGDTCTSADACRSGTCTGAAVSCTDADHCTTDRCETAAGCVHGDLPGLTLAWVQCSVHNVRDAVRETAPCARRCVRRLERQLAAIARKLDAGTAARRGCARVLAGCARKARGLQRRIAGLVGRADFKPAAAGALLGTEATRLSMRVASFAEGFCQPR